MSWWQIALMVIGGIALGAVGMYVALIVAFLRAWSR